MSPMTKTQTPKPGTEASQYNQTRDGLSKRPIRQVEVLSVDGDTANVVALNGPVKGCQYSVPVAVLRWV